MTKLEKLQKQLKEHLKQKIKAPGYAPRKPARDFENEEENDEDNQAFFECSTQSWIGKRFKLLDILKDMPKNVLVEDLYVDICLNGNTCNPKAEFWIGTSKTIPNPKYIKLKAKYDAGMATYPARHAEWSKQAKLWRKFEDGKRYLQDAIWNEEMRGERELVKAKNDKDAERQKAEADKAKVAELVAILKQAKKMGIKLEDI